MTEINANIISIGTSVPENVYQQEDLAYWMATSLDPNDDRLKRKLNVLYRKTEINSRHSVLSDFHQLSDKNRLFKPDNLTPKVEERLAIYKKEVMNLSMKAVEDCLQGFDKKKITHLIFVSCTGMTAPGIEIQLKKALNLKTNVLTHAINFVGCYAAFPALKLARSFCNIDEEVNVLIVSTEICTIHFQNKTGDDFILSNSLFADGSAAVLINNKNTENEISLRILEQRQIHIYDGKDDMAWDIHSDGFLMKLSNYVPQLVNAEIENLLNSLFDNFNSEHKNIDYWAIHPGGRKILEVCQKQLQLDKQQLKESYQVLSQYGNMSAPTILFVLKEILSKKKAVTGQLLFACGFGPGLTLEGSLFEVN